MIRRLDSGSFLLITQHDHALLSGKLAQHLGNGTFAMPAPYGPCIEAISLHDSGWPLHDEHATLNPQNEPLHVFETPVDISVRVWTASVDRASAASAYSGLLVSLHVMGLSMLSMAHHTDPQSKFKLLKFQHQQVERQMNLRRELGMRVDIPLEHGLAKTGLDPAEDQLRFNFHIVQVMDRLSLALCCSEKLFDQIDNIPPRPGAPGMTLNLAKDDHGVLNICPWPFDRPQLNFDVPCRRLQSRPYRDESELHRYYAAASAETLAVALRE